MATASSSRPKPKLPAAPALYVAFVDEVRKLLVDRLWRVDFADERPPVCIQLLPTGTEPPVEALPWVRVQAALDVFFPKGLAVTIEPSGQPALPPEPAATRLSRGSRAAAKEMAALRQIKVLPSKRRRIAVKAVRERWRRVRAAREQSAELASLLRE